MPVISPEVPTSASSSPSVTALHHPSSQVVCLLTTKEDRVPVFIPFTHSCPAPAFPQLPTLFFCPALFNLLPGQDRTNYTLRTMGSKDSSINDRLQGGKRQWRALSSRLAIWSSCWPPFRRVRVSYQQRWFTGYLKSFLPPGTLVVGGTLTSLDG